METPPKSSLRTGRYSSPQGLLSGLPAFLLQASGFCRPGGLGADAGFGLPVAFDELLHESLKGQVPVAALQSGFGGNDSDTGGNVNEADGARYLVPVLTSGPTAPEGVDFDFFLEGSQVGGVGGHFSVSGVAEFRLRNKGCSIRSPKSAI